MVELWVVDLPLCPLCTIEDHSGCDLYYRPGYGVMACGCTDPAHRDDRYDDN